MSDHSSHDDATPRRSGHLHHPLRGLAGEGAERAVREALEGLPGILKIEVSSDIAFAEVVFDEAVLDVETVRGRLEQAGMQHPKGAAPDAAATRSDAGNAEQ